MDHVEAGLGGHLQLVLPGVQGAEQLGEDGLASDGVEGEGTGGTRQDWGHLIKHFVKIFVTDDPIMYVCPRFPVPVHITLKYGSLGTLVIAIG